MRASLKKPRAFCLGSAARLPPTLTSVGCDRGRQVSRNSPRAASWRVRLTLKALRPFQEVSCCSPVRSSATVDWTSADCGQLPIENTEQWITWLGGRWRTQQTARRNVNCRTYEHRHFERILRAVICSPPMSGSGSVCHPSSFLLALGISLSRERVASSLTVRDCARSADSRVVLQPGLALSSCVCSCSRLGEFLFSLSPFIHDLRAGKVTRQI